MGSVSNLIASMAARPILGIKKNMSVEEREQRLGILYVLVGFGPRTTPQGLDLSLLDCRGHRRGGKQPIHYPVLRQVILSGSKCSTSGNKRRIYIRPPKIAIHTPTSQSIIKGEILIDSLRSTGFEIHILIINSFVLWKGLSIGGRHSQTGVI